jgi:hypothetical protein
MRPTRRQILKWGLGAGALAGIGLGGRRLLPPRPSAQLEPAAALAARLYDGLDEKARAAVCFGYDHPLRQYHNRGVDTGGGWTFFLGNGARQVLVDLVHAGLSEKGRARIPEQWVSQIFGIHLTRLAIFGDPHAGPYQVLVTGPHLNLRLGGRSREGVAFGGPQVYGDQGGNDEVGLPGNVYREQLMRGQRFFASLTKGERQAARCARAPVQTDIGLRGVAGSFDGIPVANLGARSRQLARDAVDEILATYAEEDSAYARECLAQNGGVDALHAADYAVDHQGGRNVGDGPSQIYRFEGPAAVFYFRGEPHLHAFVNVGMDGERPLSVGEILAENPAVLDRPGVKRLFEGVLRGETGADIAYCHAETVAGRLRAGTIRSGDIYCLESWRNRVAVLEIRGRDMADPLRAAFAARGDRVEAASTYRVATTDYAADELAETELGRAASNSPGRPFRDAAIDWVRAHGLASAHTGGFA